MSDTPWGKEKQLLTYMTSTGGRTSTYGGKLVENATQGIARDILADALKKLDSKDYKIIFHVHDEIIIEGTFPPEDIEQIMCDLEPWAEGNVIDAEGFNCKRYRKG
jgi:DNA polymerase bacteriophage-type